MIVPYRSFANFHCATRALPGAHFFQHQNSQPLRVDLCKGWTSIKNVYADVRRYFRNDAVIELNWITASILSILLLLFVAT